MSGDDGRFLVALLRARLQSTWRLRWRSAGGRPRHGSSVATELLTRHERHRAVRQLYRLLSAWGDLRAARRGPGALARRHARRAAHRGLSRALRKVLRP